MTASNPPSTKASIPSRSYKTQTARRKICCAPTHRPAEPLGDLLEYAPLTQASPQAEGSQDKAVPLSEEAEPFFPRILNLDFGLSISAHHTLYSSFDIPGAQESRRGKKEILPAVRHYSA